MASLGTSIGALHGSLGTPGAPPEDSSRVPDVPRGGPMAGRAERWRSPLQLCLRTLWGVSPAMGFAAASPFIAGRDIQLPPDAPAAITDPWGWYRAATAHAAAHLVYSPPSFDGRGLKPIVRALVGVLEDARVEALAGREFPGLRRLWASLHTVQPEDGDDIATLLLRLARALAEPTRDDDPHPWVRKGRALFFADARGEVLGLSDPGRLRHAASLLGNDLGQMRLGFDARRHTPGPGYRDDNRWMWPEPAAAGADEPAPTPAPVLLPPPDVTRDVSPDVPHDMRHDPPPPTDVTQGPVHLHPEWDRLIGRLRQDWCQVRELPAPPGAEPPWPAGTPGRRAQARAIAQALSDRPAGHVRLADSGEGFEPDALVRARIAQRLRRRVDPRVYREQRRAPARGHAILLVDQSASSAEPWGRSGTSLLRAALQAAELLAEGLEARGVATAVWGFHSNGRADVRLCKVKDFGERADSATRPSLALLHSGGSTRLGAALRHATKTVVRLRGRGPRRVVVLSDATPHDIDVHDPLYLLADGRHAVHEAARANVRMACLALDPRGHGAARNVFGAGHVAPLDTLGRMPGVLRRLGI